MTHIYKIHNIVEYYNKQDTNDLLIDRFIMILSVYLFDLTVSSYIFCTGSFSIIDISSYYQFFGRPIRPITIYNFKN